MKHRYRLALGLVVVLLSLGQVAAQSTPQIIKFQGFLSDTSGGSSVPANGTFDMTFALYDADLGGLLIASVGPQAVTMSDGLYSVDLPFVSTDFDGTERWIEITVDGETLLPRVRMVSAPFAYKAETLDGFEGTDLEESAEIVAGDANLQTQVDDLDVRVGTVETSGGNTLDEAYDQGGPGAGRTITADSGPVRVEGASGLRVDGPAIVGVDSMTGSFFEVAPPYDPWNQARLTFDTVLAPTSDSISARINGRLHRPGDFPPNTPGAAFFKLGGTANTGVTAPFEFNAGSLSLEVDTVGPGERYSSAFRFRTLRDSVASEPSEVFAITGNGDVIIGNSENYVNRQLVIRGPNEPADINSVQDIAFEFASAGRAEIRGYRGSSWDTYLEFWTSAMDAGPDNSQRIMQVASNGVAIDVDLAIDGRTTTNVLQIMGGADIAEPFPVADDDYIAEGAVLVIDDDNAGQLRLSTEAYDYRVAGVVSGAGGVNAGLVLGQEDALGYGPPVAMSGRVYCQATAENGPIRPGDLLTTSDIPGHAMRATKHRRSQGSILGKAMSFLDEGEGLVLVLVNLQ